MKRYWMTIPHKSHPSMMEYHKDGLTLVDRGSYKTVKSWPLPKDVAVIPALARGNGVYAHDCTSCTHLEFNTIEEADALMGSLE